VRGKLAEVDEDSVRLWTWLGNVLEELGQDGMSSDESAVEDEVEVVFRQKIMPWRRKMDKELDFIDSGRLGQRAFGKQGSKPVRRYRLRDNLVSTREPVDGLPRCLYDDNWFTHRTGRDRQLKTSSKHFEWRTIVWNNVGRRS
jgi:hypothetical protein